MKLSNYSEYRKRDKEGGARRVRTFIKGLFTKEWSIYDKVLCVTTAALAGLVTGFLFSPIKKGVHVLSDNGSKNGSGNGSKNDHAEGMRCGKKGE